MKGKYVAGGIVLTALIAGAAIYYLQVYAYYRPVPADAPAAVIHLAPDAGGTPDTMLTSAFQAIDADSSPLRFRACFQTSMSLAMLTEGYRVYANPTPLIAPHWFSCFDAGQLDADLQSGKAVAFLSDENIHPGVDRVVAVYADGRAFAWQQLNESADQ
ncbi:MAG: DUF6446 family protein [Paracoccaceae bacterium]|mgnify:CR=1 FL=1